MNFLFGVETHGDVHVLSISLFYRWLRAKCLPVFTLLPERTALHNMFTSVPPQWGFFFQFPCVIDSNNLILTERFSHQASSQNVMVPYSFTHEEQRSVGSPVPAVPVPGLHVLFGNNEGQTIPKTMPHLLCLASLVLIEAFGPWEGLTPSLAPRAPKQAMSVSFENLLLIISLNYTCKLFFFP